MQSTDSSIRAGIKEICSDLHISNEQAHLVRKSMSLALEQGLNHPGSSSVKCLPTFVRNMPSGQEKGKYLALDLGGTNFRVLVVELFGSPQKQPLITVRKYPIPVEVRSGSGEQLFDHIASSIMNFLSEIHLNPDNLALGFTFSFPCEQSKLTSAKLTQWTKGFSCSGVVGEDICTLLRASLDKQGLEGIRICALLNDTTGCLLSCSLRESRCQVGLIVGTGCNACYVENCQNIKALPDELEGDMVVNTEWGAFGELGELDFIRTKWDRVVDQESINPGKQIFEKMISGMYLGALVRQVLLELVSQGSLFQGVNHQRLICCQDAFETRHICEVENDPLGENDRCRMAMTEVLGHSQIISPTDCYAIRLVCEEVSRRACMVLAAGVAGLLRRLHLKDAVIAVDGTLIRCHPLFTLIMSKKITQLMGEGYKFELRLARDGSGLGAAIMAAVQAKSNE
uniref:Phosphotransferase n=1 Tax=Tigriopus japonicus TaxID=158387 RepID=A0A3S6CIU1_TIGJA|nr:hexokinase 1B [Tigriopus japonicus]